MAEVFELEHPVAHNTHWLAASMARKDALILASLEEEGWLERILERIAIGEDGCLDWAGALDSGGYPEVHIPAAVHRNATAKVHRALWLSSNGPIDYGLVVNHKCHRRVCCELGHMEVTTQAANIRDRGPAPAPAPDPNQYVLFGSMAV